jgi:acyl dehydratase
MNTGNSSVNVSAQASRVLVEGGMASHYKAPLRPDKRIHSMPTFANLADLEPLVGQEIAVGAWVPVTQEAIDAFARVTGDDQWIHIDPERARRESPYGTTIAHGFLTLSFISALHGRNVQVEGVVRTINYGLNRVRFPAPVRAGSSVRGRSRLAAWERIDAAVQTTWLITIEVQDQPKPALVAEWVLRHYVE